MGEGEGRGAAAAQSSPFSSLVSRVRYDLACEGVIGREGGAGTAHKLGALVGVDCSSFAINAMADLKTSDRSIDVRCGGDEGESSVPVVPFVGEGVSSFFARPLVTMSVSLYSKLGLKLLVSLSLLLNTASFASSQDGTALACL